MKNIYVGNLPFGTTDDLLRQLFEQYGEVLKVTIITDRETGRSRGFGFVEMAEESSASEAITQLSGSEMDGRTLTVNEARPRGEGGGGADRRRRDD